MSENIYIHYGSDKFEKELFMSIVNRNMINKPFGGLWASDIKADQPWEKWCIDNDFRIDKLDKNFKFTLDDSANIVEWTAKADLKQVPTQDLSGYLPEYLFDTMGVVPDFEKMVEDGVDAIKLNLSKGDYELYYELYGWGCDNILIMNPDIIRPLQKLNNRMRLRSLGAFFILPKFREQE